MHFASVVPADSPDRPTRGLTPPGTGPYRPIAWDARRGGTFVRNRYFRSDPARPRGEGFADRIEVRGRTASGRSSGKSRAVQRGDADLTVLADPFGPLVSEGRSARSWLARPGRLRSAPAPTTDWAFLNVRRRPFDDIRVRRALNLAIDRAKVVALSGGPEVGEPTCQVVPADFPGYAPYCPYTARRRAKGGGGPRPTWLRRAGSWRPPAAPASASSSAVPDFRGRLGRAMYAKLLNRLGFRTTLRVLSFNDPEGDSRTQIGLTGWGADYLGASNFIEPDVHVRATAGRTTSRDICDPRLERLIDRAAITPPADAARAWAAADHRVTDLARSCR